MSYLLEVTYNLCYKLNVAQILISSLPFVKSLSVMKNDFIRVFFLLSKGINLLLYINVSLDLKVT